MATLTWRNRPGEPDDWYDPNQWETAGGTSPYPQPGDAAVVPAGEVDLVGTEAKNNGTFDANAVTLGTAGSPAVVLRAEGAILNHFFAITLAGSAEILAQGRSVLQGPVTDAVAGSTLTLASAPGASTLDLQNGFSLSLGAGATLDLQGNIAVEATAGFATPSTASVVNDAAVTQIGVRNTINGALTGTGTWNLKFGTTLALGGSVGAGQTIAFGGIDGRLILSEAAGADGSLAGFAGTVTGFSPGNLIDFAKVSATGARYDAGARRLTLTDAGGAAVATLDGVSAQAGRLQAAPDGSGGTLVSYAGTGTRLSYEIAGADRAMGSDTVRSMLTVPATATPITGAGVKVGIISTGFDVDGQANADAKAGYLPANPDGTSAVKVLKDATSGEDEGRAMAELVHQVAPGAAIDFSTGGGSQSSMAAAIAALQADGCKVIVDDLTFFDSPIYQVGGPLDTAVNAALAAGVDYFTSAGNYGDSFLQQAFTPQAETLYDGLAVQAHVFGGGTPYENITVPANNQSRIDLQWTAPYQGPNNAGAPDALSFQVFDSAHKLVAASSPVKEGGVATTDIYAPLPKSTSAQTYSVAVYLNGGQVQPDAFSLIVSAFGNSTGPGAVIDDPEAASGPNGDVRGQEVIPGVNAVGATFYGDSPAFGEAPTAAEYFSDSGPGQILYDAEGRPLPAPVVAGKANFAAPDGVNTAVPGFAGFYGTSAAAPDAAAVAALMLQADPNLSEAQVTALLEGSAIPFGQPQWAGAGLIQAPGAVEGAIAAAETPGAVALSPRVAFADGVFTLSGIAASTAGVRSVEISAVVDGARRDLGAATVRADGTFDFADAIGDPQSFFEATLTNAAGGQAASADPGFSLSLGGGGRTGLQQSFGPAALASTTLFGSNGQRQVSVEAPGQTVDLLPYDTVFNHRQGDNAFVYVPGPASGAVDVVHGFKVGGADHDVLSLKGADFGDRIAQVLRDAGDVNGSAFITDPVTGEAVRLAGVTTAQLKAHPKDVAFA